MCDRERLQLNEDTLWDGYPIDASNPASLEALPEVRRLLFAGRNKDAVELAGRTMMGRPERVKPYQSLGELMLQFPELSSVSGYRRSLDLDAAVAVRELSAGWRCRYARGVFLGAGRLPRRSLDGRPAGADRRPADDDS